MVIFNSYVNIYQRVYYASPIQIGFLRVTQASSSRSQPPAAGRSWGQWGMEICPLVFFRPAGAASDSDALFTVHPELRLQFPAGSSRCFAGRLTRGRRGKGFCPIAVRSPRLLGDLLERAFESSCGLKGLYMVTTW